MAGTTCSGTLTEDQRKGFVALFNPPYSAKLIHVGGAITEANMSKLFSKDDSQKLRTPRVAASGKLNVKQADDLAGWLNENANAELPGWIAASTAIVIPSPWYNASVDVLIQLVNAQGSAGRQKAANLAGRVSKDGLIGVTEQVANDSSGNPKFVWTYVYQANLNGQQVTTPLAVCSADIVVR